MVMITSQALEKVEPSDISRLLSGRQRRLDVRANPPHQRCDWGHAGSIQRRMNDPVIDKVLKIRRPV
jgi:hypothetical protein